MHKPVVDWGVALDAVNEGILIIDKDCSIIEGNKGFSILMGIKRADFIGRKCYEIIYGEGGRNPSCPCPEVRKRSAPMSSEFNRGSDGKTFSLTAYPVFDSTGEVLWMVNIIKDVTMRVLAEKKLMETIEELEKWQRVTIGREVRMIELKKAIKELKKRLREVEKRF
jgi:PAS domain S-box-containing protein